VDLYGIGTRAERKRTERERIKGNAEKYVTYNYLGERTERKRTEGKGEKRERRA
jgi:hypothetical protein